MQKSHPVARMAQQFWPRQITTKPSRVAAFADLPNDHQTPSMLPTLPGVEDVNLPRGAKSVFSCAKLSVTANAIVDHLISIELDCLSL